MRTSLALFSALAVGVTASLFSVNASAQALAPSSPQASHQGQQGSNGGARSGDQGPRNASDFHQAPQIREVRDFHERHDDRGPSRGGYVPTRTYSSPRDSFSIGVGISDGGFATSFNYATGGRNNLVVGGSYGYPRATYYRPAPVIVNETTVYAAPAPVYAAPEPVAVVQQPTAVYAPAPVVYSQPVVYAPAPVVYAQPTVIYQSAPVYYCAPPVVYYAPAPCYRPTYYGGCGYPAYRSGLSFSFSYRGR